MRALFGSVYPNGTFLEIKDRADWREKAAAADEIVLLYPDPLGLGFRKVEIELFGLKGQGASLVVLNGRRRHFELDEATYRGLRLRRLVKMLMAGEVPLVAIFLLATPFLLVIDLMGGKR